MKNAKIFKLFLDIHMGLGHDGLSAIAKKAKVKLEELETGDLLMFINRKGDKLKVLGAQGKVVGYLRTPGGRLIMKDALQYLPHTFGASGFDYDAACTLVLNRRLGLAV